MHSKQRENDGKQKELGGLVWCGTADNHFSYRRNSCVSSRAAAASGGAFFGSTREATGTHRQTIGTGCPTIGIFREISSGAGADTHAGGSPLSRLWLFGNSPDRHFTALTAQAIRDVV